jgi:hypothetical protein
VRDRSIGAADMSPTKVVLIAFLFSAATAVAALVLS